ncbi:MAG: hypothetical protein KDB53_05500, partial [Planctomycetes bacterium]|nr:hypothetical protein [Planctomycetota bacterium]
MPQGDAEDAPPPRRFSAGWMAGAPDHIVTMAEPFAVAADGPDDYVWIVLPSGVTEDCFLASVDFWPEPRRVVHHVIALLDVTGQARALDAADPGPGYRRFGDPGFPPFATLGVWGPGTVPHRLPKGYAREFPAGADIVLQLHCTKTGRPESVNFRIGLHFAKEKVERLVFTVLFGSPDMRIPAGAAAFKVKDTMIAPTRSEILAIGPHMHLLGRSYALSTETPEGRIEELIRIDDWDFDWQLPYVFRAPLIVTPGTKLHMTGVFDNSAGNPRNPHHPPREVRTGPSSTDEMLATFIDVSLPDDPMLENLRKLFPIDRK